MRSLKISVTSAKQVVEQTVKLTVIEDALMLI